MPTEKRPDEATWQNVASYKQKNRDFRRPKVAHILILLFLPEQEVSALLVKLAGLSHFNMAALVRSTIISIHLQNYFCPLHI